jgi:hypothetical protein
MSTLVMAIATVTAALGCRLAIKKVARCSSPGTIMADALSKAQLSKFRGVARKSGWEPLAAEPAWSP